MYDLVIKNALIADGLGTPLLAGDLAVSGGRVAAIGRLPGPAGETMDAAGLVLAPGVIDVHTHYDAQLTWDPTASPSPALGVTTVVIGNCGFGIAPATPDVRDILLANLSVVEGMSLESLKAGVDWGFETFLEYLGMLQRKGVYPNVAAFASHSAIRTVVMKDEAWRREASPAELEAMVALLREAMRAGAIGLGSSTFENHNGAGGIPMPSRLANDDEFRAFARVLREHGTGLIMMTCGDRTTIPFLEELATISGRPVVYAPLLYYGNQPGRAGSIVEQCRAARRRGAPVYAQASCQPLSMDFTLESAYPMLTVQPWPDIPHGDPAGMKAAFADQGFRQRMRESLSRPEGGRIFNGNWDGVEVTIAATPAMAKLEGRTIAEIAREHGADPVDTFLDLGLAEDLKTTFTAKLLNADEDRVEELLRDSGNLVSLSDGGAHLTFFCDAGFGMHFLGRWVRERRAFGLPGAIRKLTSDVADIYGIVDRGRLAVDAWADMILFDPETIGVSRTERVADLPGGASRLIRYAPGLHAVWVNGVKVFDGKAYVPGVRPGQVLAEFKGTRPTVAMSPS